MTFDLLSDRLSDQEKTAGWAGESNTQTMLTQEQERPAEPGGHPRSNGNDPTRAMNMPRFGRESIITRLAIAVAVVMVLIATWLILSVFLVAGSGSETISSDGEPVETDQIADDSTPANAEVADTDTDAESDTESAPVDTDTESDTESEAGQADAATDATGTDQADTDTDAGQSGAESGLPVGAAVPEELEPVVAEISASLRQLDPTISEVRMSQDVIDYLVGWQPIDPEAVLVSSCSPGRCSVWLDGDSYESSFTFQRDGGTLIFLSAN